MNLHRVKDTSDEDSDGHIIVNTTWTRCYYFRARVSQEDEGEIKSENYRETYGDFKKFVYYFTPNAYDRNLEFDPNKNLLKDGTRMMRVMNPQVV